MQGVSLSRRRLLHASLFIPTLTLVPPPLLAGEGWGGVKSAPEASGEATPFDAVVSTTPHKRIPTYATITEAIASAPAEGTKPFRILITRGRWHEKLLIDKPHVHLIGEDRAGSVLTYDAAAGMARPDGEPWGTWGCASVTVRAPDFRASNLVIENAFDYVGNLAAPKFEPIGPNGAQAVALMELLDLGRRSAEEGRALPVARP